MSNSTENASLEAYEKALTLCRQRLSKIPPQLEVLRSVEKQLEYLIAVTRGAITDRSRLKDIILDIYAVREFETDDPEFADALSDAMQFAKLLRSGPWTL